MKRRATAFVVGILLLSFLACSSARRGQPFTRPLPVSNSHLEAGELLFMQHCNFCHPGGAGGLGPALNNKPLPAFAIRTQVRHGLGAMPAFSEDQISPAQLDDLVLYLKALRHEH